MFNNPSHRNIISLLVVFFFIINFNVFSEVPQLIDYQGSLKASNGQPMNTSVPMTFTIYDALNGGTVIWSEIHPPITVEKGLFHVLLGSVNTLPGTVFSDTNRYLGITIDTEELSPRSRLVSVPFSYTSLNSDTSKYSFIAKYSDSTESITDGAVDLSDIGQNGATIGQVMKWNGSAWVTTVDETGSSTGWVDDGNVVRLETIDDSVGIGTIAPSEKLHVEGNLLLTGKATIGSGNTNTGEYSFVAGYDNIASGDSSTICGGTRNEASGITSIVCGGVDNTASGDFSVVSGGRWNSATGLRAVVSGGQSNHALENYATVGGGWQNSAARNSSTVAGGYWNSALGSYASVGGGSVNHATSSHAHIGGGSANTCSTLSAICGGSTNTVASYGFIGGGLENMCLGTFGTISGGRLNYSYSGGGYGTIAGGDSNSVNGFASTVGGGSHNFAGTESLRGDYSTVPGGRNNAAEGKYSFAAGFRAKSLHDGTFVWADEIGNEDFESTGDNQFLVRAKGGVGINTNSPQSALHIGGTPSEDGIVFPDGTKQTTSASNLSLHYRRLAADNTHSETQSSTYVKVGEVSISPSSVSSYVNVAVRVKGSLPLDDNGTIRAWLDFRIGENGSEISKDETIISEYLNTTGQTGYMAEYKTFQTYYEPTQSEKANGFDVEIFMKVDYSSSAPTASLEKLEVFGL